MLIGTLEPAVDDRAAMQALYRAWQGLDAEAPAAPARIKDAKLTVHRSSPDDFQDRQVFLFVDDEPWGKLKYGVPVTREVSPGRHHVRVFNTLFSHTLVVDVAPGEHARLRCTNGMPLGGWLFMLFLHVTYLRVRLERE
ncbi:MAG: hypothetical protein AB1635_12760 [Acidobacteriota bacterium]